jgi:hypothetical protein
MFVIPFQYGEKKFSIVIVLQTDSIERIQKYDPAAVNIGKLGSPWSSMELVDVHIAFANEEDMNHICELATAGKMQEGLQYLGRGFKFCPEAGDHDMPYTSIFGKPQA